MTALTCASLVFLGCASTGFGLDLPALSQIIDQHIQSIGGRAALEKSGPLLLTGRCESTAPEESGPVEILVKTPKVVYDLNHGGLRMGFDGASVWRETATEGLQKRPGRQFAELVTVFDPARALLWKEWYPQMMVEGVRKAGDREAYVLATQPGGPLTERLLIDRESGLLVRDELPMIAFIFSDYREVNGVRVAFAVEQTTPNGITYSYRFEKIQAASEADDSRFQPK